MDVTCLFWEPQNIILVEKLRSILNDKDLLKIFSIRPRLRNISYVFREREENSMAAVIAQGSLTT